MGRRAWTRRAINTFIFWHLFALTIWLLPSSALVQLFKPLPDGGLVRPYMTLTGFWQGWYVFAPNPMIRTVYIEARITYANGTVRSWYYPRMQDRDAGSRAHRVRFRNLVVLGQTDQVAFLWPSLARYAARRNNADPRNPPVSVTLVRRSRDVPPPGATPPLPQMEPFFTMPIAPQELR